MTKLDFLCCPYVSVDEANEIFLLHDERTLYDLFCANISNVAKVWFAAMYLGLPTYHEWYKHCVLEARGCDQISPHMAPTVFHKVLNDACGVSYLRQLILLDRVTGMGGLPT